MKRLIAAILAITNTLNGVAMLASGPLWYTSVPGAADTGPYNPHFVPVSRVQSSPSRAARSVANFGFKGTLSFIILVWFRFRSSLEGRAGKIERTSEPPHEIGAACLVAGIALGVGAWRPAYWPAAVTGAAFIVLHGLIHLVSIASGHNHHATFDLLAVVIPSALALYCALPDKGVRHA